MKKTTVKSSMPKTPALRGKRWTRKLASRVLGRWVLVGWIDTPAAPLLVISEGGPYGEPLGYNPKDGVTIDIDSPEQIIDIGPRLERAPYSKSGGEWVVEKS